ncbi:ATP-binding protein [Streptomyces sp. ADI96-02]|uniref:ATP-binding protein n=1 Tax=Streptomyces sp. ADI96-02 TaxID=1522760 RepID=UPI0019D00A24|nr:ATP-binding protein [Streptomyces sp. ADI96-02]
MAEPGPGCAGELEEAPTVPLPQDAAAARDVVTRLLTSQSGGPAGERLTDVAVADALLVTSELVTNAIRHGGGLTGFAAELTREGLRLAVADASRARPVNGHATPAGSTRIGGYGWPLVCRLARTVSVTVHPGGKRIEAVIRLS